MTMKDDRFLVLPKVVGLIIDRRTGEVAGVVDGHGFLPQEVMRSLADVFGQAVNAAMEVDGEEDEGPGPDPVREDSRATTLAQDRARLERMYRLPARDVEREREGDR